ncbi:MAG: hypothetical protein REI64_04895 [Pedobacter sp.]|uniref:hypothetical protein n=1 Tax=Pedobacter sp. TaxID=1411316 RepID=UPI00280975FB|nr:hypothetical protein [Pedobacter sp.]MDQ8004116.1 hypothetical protein [Pedobacter sp.]
MKKTITRTALATLVLLLSLTFSSYAQTYYDVYICGSTSVKLRPQESIINVNDKVHWYLEGVEVAGSPFTYTASGTADLTVPANLAVGLHKYTTAIESAGGCLGDPSDPYEVYKLPTKDLALTKSVATYCGANSGGTSGSVITATTTPAATLPDGIAYAYTWSATESGNPATPGTADNSSSATSLYTMNTTTAGTYVFNATVKYVLTAANTGTLVAADTDGCSVAAASTQTVIVTPKPLKPTISLVN